MSGGWSSSGNGDSGGTRSIEQQWKYEQCISSQSYVDEVGKAVYIYWAAEVENM